MHVSLAVATEPGLVRPRYEDFYCVEPLFGLFAIAEGAGPIGGLASRTVVRALRQFIVETGGEHQERRSAGDAPFVSVSDRLLAGLKVAFGAIGDGEGLAPDESGATLCALLFEGVRVAMAWTRDCSIYRLHVDRFERLRVTSVTRSPLLAVHETAAVMIHELEPAPNEHWLLSVSGLPRVLTKEETTRILESASVGHSSRQRSAIEITVPDSGTPRTVLIVGDAAL